MQPMSSKVMLIPRRKARNPMGPQKRIYSREEGRSLSHNSAIEASLKVFHCCWPFFGVSELHVQADIHGSAFVVGEFDPLHGFAFQSIGDFLGCLCFSFDSFAELGFS